MRNGPRGVSLFCLSKTGGENLLRETKKTTRAVRRERSKKGGVVGGGGGLA